MRIAVITLHRVYNYGSCLQAYATQSVFEKAGYDTVIVDYITPQLTKRQLMKNAAAGANRRLPGWLYKTFKLISILAKEATFGRFIKAHLHLTKKYFTADDLKKYPPRADIYVTGSDQTWNSFYNQGVDQGFFLRFGPEETPRFAFAASFGKTALDEKELLETRQYIEAYRGISVREDSALQVLRQLGRTDGIQLVDPTLQLTGDEWRSIASRRLVREPYLVLMLLYNEDNGATDYARKIADARGLKLVKLSWELKCPPKVDKLYTHRSPADFLSLFANADFVVTNSFHGLAFSINLHRQFIVVPRSEFNSRIESLLRLTGLEQRQVTNESEALVQMSEMIEYTEAERILELERQRAARFIESFG